MYQHQHENEEYGAVKSVAAVETAHEAPESEAIEEYLDQVVAPLVPHLRRYRREEIRALVRKRLTDFTAAHIELGSTPEKAVEAAIIQCGDAAALSQRWLPEQSAQRVTAASVSRSRLSLISRLAGGAGVATVVATLLFGLPYVADVTKLSGDWWATRSDNTITYYRFMLISMPLLSGLLTGLLAKKKPVRGVVNAIVLLSLPAIALPGLLMGMSYAHIVLDENSQLSFLPNAIPAISGLLPWLLLGCTGAALGGWLRAKAAKVQGNVARNIRISRGTSRVLREHSATKLNNSSCRTVRAWNIGEERARNNG